MVNDLTDLSHVVSHALRHEPWVYELEIDDEGWAEASTLLKALREGSPGWPYVTEEDLKEMIRVSSSPRHELANGRIRALYGHSLVGKLIKRRAMPPIKLFHGTSHAAELRIRQEGLLPMHRQFVHLSTDRETALAVGRRKSREPIVLSVEARRAHKSGTAFYIGNEKVWLADRLLPEFIEFSE